MVSRYLDPKVLAKIDRLDLKAKHIVEGYISGMHRSPYHGFSVEFAQYRGYVPGDDLKHLDWKVFAKSGRYYLKQYEEETNLAAYLLLDGSESMAFVSPKAAGGLTKLEYGKLVTASIAHLVLSQSDAAAVAIFDQGIREFIEKSTRDVHIHRICAALETHQPQKRTSIGGMLHELAERIRRRGIVVVVSDLFDDTDNLIAGLRHLRHRGHEVVVLHTLDEFELTLPYDGLIQFKGLEDTGTVLCHPRLIKKQYLEELHKFLTRVRSACLKTGSDYVQLSTTTPVDVALSAYLASRERMRKVGRFGGRPR